MQEKLSEGIINQQEKPSTLQLDIPNACLLYTSDAADE